MNHKQIHRKLLSWYKQERRSLPWRKNKDPYRIWISEIMLQQTRVEAVIPYYERFLAFFPAVEDLAAAPTDRLLNLWAGLGYYSRARNLQKAAQSIMANHGGKFPRSPGELRTLPGIGPYTAAAIASIAFSEAAAAIDGNLERVFSRLLCLEKNPKTAGKKEIAAFGAVLVANGSPGDLNQAFMDLAAKICLPKQPRCAECPLQANCLARAEGKERLLPVKPTKKEKIELCAEGIILLAEEKILLGRRAPGEWLQGMWDIPWWIPSKTPVSLPENFGEEIHRCAHQRNITRHKIQFSVRALKSTKRTNKISLSALPPTASEYKWISLCDLQGIHLPRASEKALSAALLALK